MNNRVIKIDSNDTTRSLQSNMVLVYMEILRDIAEQDSAPLDIKNDWKQAHMAPFGFRRRQCGQQVAA